MVHVSDTVRIQSNDPTNKQVDALSWNDRCQMLILNPVVVTLLKCCSLMLNRMVK